MTKLRKSLNLKVAVIGAVALTAFSGFVSESAQASNDEVFWWEECCKYGGCTRPGESTAPYCAFGNSRRRRKSTSVSRHKFLSIPSGNQDTQFFQPQVFSEQSGFVFESTFDEDFLANDESSQPNNAVLLQSATVNEPSNKLGLITLGAFGIKLALKRKRKYSTN